MLMLQSCLLSKLSSIFTLLLLSHRKYTESQGGFEEQKVEGLQMADTGKLKKGGASAICSQGAHPRAEWGFVFFQSVSCGSCTVQSMICFVHPNYWNLLAGAGFSFLLSVFVHGISISYLPILILIITICLFYSRPLLFR